MNITKALRRALSTACSGAALLGAALLGPASASANERHFTYTYESAALPEDALELELWTTSRIGREERYIRFDNRLELEIGLSDRLLTAFYVNTEAKVSGTGDETETEYAFAGVSSEWKYKLSDASADALGSALYGEVTFGPEELELEAKVILDKRAGDVLLALNAVGELEVKDLGDANELEPIVEVDLAATYFITPAVSLGLELRNHTALPEGELEHSAFYLGPTAAWRMGPAWGALSVLGQIGAVLPKENEAGDREGVHFARDLAHAEAVNARFLLGLSL
ncbi:MAG: hypothetical protein HY908_27420 [Myxococcales bacterium]|nr:hypothetical protein [Myxococcales bacterium]